MKLAFRPLWVAVLIVFLLTIVVNIVRFPAAPLSQQGSSFVDKQGRFYTAEEFHAYQRCNLALTVAGAAWALVSVADAMRYYRDRRKGLPRRTLPNEISPTLPTA